MTNTHCDVVVIGGGIIGAAIAYYGSKSGLDITVLERGDIASGTSSKCDGDILAVDKDPGFDSKMSFESQKLVAELSKELDIPFEYRSPGSVLVCENEVELEAAERWVSQQQKAGLDFKMLNREDLRNESSYLADNLFGGLECSTDSIVNPYLFTFSMMDKAKQYGAKIHTHTEVTNLHKNQDGTFIIETTNGTFTANKVVNACGAWSPFICRMLGLDIPIKPRKGHVIVASRQQQVSSRNIMEFGYLISKFGGERQVDPLTEKYGVALVMEPTESQNFLVGSSRQFLGYDTKVNHDVVKHIAKRAVRFFPKIDDMAVIRAYAGLRPWTEDHLPFISHVEKVPGFYVAAGHEGDGISLAAVTGKLIAEMINGTETTVPVEPLHFERFNV